MRLILVGVFLAATAIQCQELDLGELLGDEGSGDDDILEVCTP